MTQQELYLKYPKIFDLSFTHRVSWGIPETWVPLVDSLCHEIQEYCDTHDCEQVRCVQVKEKFGALRFYVDSAVEDVYNMIRQAEEKSYDLCQECGSTENLVRTKGWIKILCKPCSIKLDKEVYED